VIRSQLPRHEARRLWDVSDSDEAVFRTLEKRRLSGEPLQYLEGTAAFGPLDLVVDQRVLIPRPETEQLWEMVAHMAGEPTVIVDLCTGSGALAIACKATWPEARVVATDLSREATAVARLNAKRLGVEVEVYEGDLFDALPADLLGAIDLLVSNPPYVAEWEWDGLPDDVKSEPRMALVAGPDGTEVADRIAGSVAGWLAPGGLVAMEIGETQGGHLAAVFGRSLDEVEVRVDLTGRDRFVLGRRR
jgi:release factor glutamine methyltransferase